MKFTDWLNKNWQKGNILPPPLHPQEAIHFLVDYLLGEDWYVTPPLNGFQANTEIVDAILTKYSKRYRKEKNKYNKSQNIYLGKDLFEGEKIKIIHRKFF